MTAFLAMSAFFNKLWNTFDSNDLHALAEAINKDCDIMLQELETLPEHSNYHKENVQYMKSLVRPDAFDNLEDGLGYAWGEIKGWYKTLYTNDFYLSAVQTNKTARFAFTYSLEVFTQLREKRAFDS
jgi:hypothetical protein